MPSPKSLAAAGGRASFAADVMIRRWLKLAMSVLAAAAGSCAPLEQFEKVVERVGAEKFVEADGQRVHVERWGTQGRPLVMLHGFGASTYSFREIGPRLGRNRRVVAIDLNGFGYTERPRAAEAYAPAGQVALVMRVLDELEIGEADLLGHSYGGNLALLMARDHPQRFGRVVLVSPALSIDPGATQSLGSSILRAVGYPLVRGFLSNPAAFRSVFERAFFQTEVFDEGVAWEYRRRLLVEGLRRAYCGFGATLDRFSAERADLSDVKQSVLVLAGRHDQVIPLRALQWEIRELPRVRLTVLEESGHSGPEEQPREVAAAVERFLRGDDALR